MCRRGEEGEYSRFRQIFLVYQGYLSLLTLLEVVSAVGSTARGKIITHNFIFSPWTDRIYSSFPNILASRTKMETGHQCGKNPD